MFPGRYGGVWAIRFCCASVCSRPGASPRLCSPHTKIAKPPFQVAQLVDDYSLLTTGAVFGGVNQNVLLASFWSWRKRFAFYDGAFNTCATTARANNLILARVFGCFTGLIIFSHINSPFFNISTLDSRVLIQYTTHHRLCQVVKPQYFVWSPANKSQALK